MSDSKLSLAHLTPETGFMSRRPGGLEAVS